MIKDSNTRVDSLDFPLDCHYSNMDYLILNPRSHALDKRYRDFKKHAQPFCIEYKRLPNGVGSTKIRQDFRQRVLEDFQKSMGIDGIRIYENGMLKEMSSYEAARTELCRRLFNNLGRERKSERTMTQSSVEPSSTTTETESMERKDPTASAMDCGTELDLDTTTSVLVEPSPEVAQGEEASPEVVQPSPINNNEVSSPCANTLRGSPEARQVHPDKEKKRQSSSSTQTTKRPSDDSPQHDQRQGHSLLCAEKLPRSQSLSTRTVATQTEALPYFPAAAPKRQRSKSTQTVATQTETTYSLPAEKRQRTFVF